ncbi:MAG: BACON domain-containing protein [Alistipes sp.]|nr:BACON domain-containing protein [Candidatus Alistipes equi]
MKKIIYLVLCLSFMAVACSKDDTKDLGLQKEFTIRVSIDDSTRTHFGEGEDALKILWNKDDEVAFLDADGVFESAVVPEECVNTNSAYFTLYKVSKFPVQVVYPASAYKGDSTFELPVKQSYVAGSFSNNTAILAGKMNNLTDAITLNSVGAYLSVKFDAAVSGLVFEANNDEPVSGLFSIDETNTLSAQSGSSALYITDIPADTKDFIVAVPAGEYTKGFVVKALVDGKYKVATAYSTGKNLNAGVKLNMPQLSVAAMSESTATVIATADELNAFLAIGSGDGLFACDIDLKDASLVPAADFTGTLDGNGYSIKNWNNVNGASLATVNSGTIKNIVIDKTCVVENLTPSDTLVAMIAQTNKGLISGCINYGSITYDITAPSAMSVGSICAEIDNGGKVENCINRGQIVAKYLDRASKQVNHGGLVGRILDESTEVRIANCVNEGSVLVEINATTPGTSDKGSCYTGGVLGTSTINAGTSSVTSGYTKYYGVVEKCSNSGYVSVNRPCGGTSSYFKIGGVVALLEGSVKDCSNSGYVEYQTSKEKANAGCGIGGVVASLSGPDSKLLNCSNTGIVFVTGAINNASNAYGSGQVGAKGCGVGGVAGVVGDQAVLIDNCYNKGDIIVETTGTSRYVGGVVGVSLAKNMSNCVNYSNITYTDSPSYSYNGGVLGCSFATTLSSCTNKGDICVSGASSKEKVLGGILGQMEANTHVIDCVNEGNVEFGELGAENAKGVIGGIAGYYSDSGISIENCTTTGNVTALKCNYTLVHAGGISGQFRGTMLNSSCKGDITVGDVQESFVGGFSGYSRYGTIDNVSYSGNIKVLGATSTASIAGMFSNVYVGNYVWQNVSFEGEITSENPANPAGFIVGSLYNDAANQISMGAEGAPITLKKGSKLNGASPVFNADEQQLGNLVGDVSKQPNAFLIVNVVDEDNPITTIADIKKSGEGTYTVSGTVVAAGVNGFILGDKTGAVYVYNKTNSLNVGDKVSVEGNYEPYNNGFEFNNPTVTAITSAPSYTYNPQSITGSDLDTMLTTTAECKECVFSGVASVGSYVNISVEGAKTAIAGLTAINASDYKDYDGKTIIVKGFHIAISQNKYCNFVPYEVTVDPNVPFLTLSASTLQFEAAGGTQTITATTNELAGFTLSASADNDSFEVSLSGNVVSVTAKSTTEAKSATLTVTYSNGEKSVSKTVTLKQSAPSTGGEKTLTLTIDDIVGGKSGNVALGKSSYGSQSLTNESTWYTWTSTSSFTGCRICQGGGDQPHNTGVLQIQGKKDSNGFICNTSSLGHIKSIEIVCLNSKNTSKPAYTVYFGTTTNPTDNGEVATGAKVEGTESLFIFTDKFEPTGDYSFFRLCNTSTYAVYMKSITIVYEEK